MENLSGKQESCQEAANSCTVEWARHFVLVSDHEIIRPAPLMTRRLDQVFEVLIPALDRVWRMMVAGLIDVLSDVLSDVLPVP